MERFEIGMLAISRAGHDKNSVYVICAVDSEYVYLVNGKTKTFERPKKKKRMHVQIIHTIPEELAGLVEGKIKNEDIRRIIDVKSRCY